MTGRRPMAFRQLGLCLAVGLAMSVAFGAWVWAQQQPSARGPVGLPPRPGTAPGARPKGLASTAPHPLIVGPRFVNVLDFKADPTGATSGQQVAIQAAIDSLISRAPGGALEGGSNNTPGTVWIPSGSYITDRPIWLDGDGIDIKGESRNATQIKCQAGAPSIIMGHRRRAKWNRAARSSEAILYGQATFTKGSKTVTGAGTQFALHFAPFLPYPLFIKATGSNTWYPVASVESDTKLELATPFTEPTVANGNYTRGVDYLKSIPSVFAADHRMDLWNGGAPKLDASMVSADGQRFGLTSKSPSSGSPFGDHWIAFPYSLPGIGIGDYWETIQSFTIDFCVEGQNGAPIGYNYLFGMGGGEQLPGPWWLTAVHGTYYRFTFRTKVGANGVSSDDAPREFTFGNPSVGKGPQRITIQMDMTKNRNGTTDGSDICDLRAWINGVEQEVSRPRGTRLTTASATEPSFTAADNLHFQSSEPGSSFVFYSGTSNALFWEDGGYPSSRGTYNLYGFRLTHGTRYTTKDGAQVRLDGFPINDSYRYAGGQDADRLICYLDTTDPKVGDWHGRFVTMVGGPGTGHHRHLGLFLNALDNENAGGYTINNTVSDLTIIGTNRAPEIILIGTALNPTIQNLTTLGGLIGIAGDVHSVYDVRIRDVLIGDTQTAWIAAFGWIVEIENLWRAGTGRFALRFDGCSVKCRNVRMGDVRNTEAYIKITGHSAYGWIYSFDTIDSDNEGLPNPTSAYIYCERHAAPATILEVTNITPGTIPVTVPLIKLVDRFPVKPGQSMGKLHAWNFLPGHLAVETDGPGWEGIVEDIISEPTDVVQWRKHTGADGESNVVVYHRMDTLPIGGTWQKNAHVIELRHPKSGQAQRYLCTQSGTVGANPAPVFTPITPLLP